MRNRNSKLSSVLRAMDAYERRNAPEPAVTCHLCGAPVEADALDVQTCADGSLMFPHALCAKCLRAGSQRLKAELQQQEDRGN